MFIDKKKKTWSNWLFDGLTAGALTLVPVYIFLLFIRHNNLADSVAALMFFSLILMLVMGWLWPLSTRSLVLDQWSGSVVMTNNKPRLHLWRWTGLMTLAGLAALPLGLGALAISVVIGAIMSRLTNRRVMVTGFKELLSQREVRQILTVNFCVLIIFLAQYGSRLIQPWPMTEYIILVFFINTILLADVKNKAYA